MPVYGFNSEKDKTDIGAEQIALLKILRNPDDLVNLITILKQITMVIDALNAKAGAFENVNSLIEDLRTRIDDLDLKLIGLRDEVEKW